MNPEGSFFAVLKKKFCESFSFYQYFYSIPHVPDQKMTKGKKNESSQPSAGKVLEFDHLIFWVANAKMVSLINSCKNHNKQSSVSVSINWEVSQHNFSKPLLRGQCGIVLRRSNKFKYFCLPLFMYQNRDGTYLCVNITRLKWHSRFQWYQNCIKLKILGVTK